MTVSQEKQPQRVSYGGAVLSVLLVLLMLSVPGARAQENLISPPPPLPWPGPASPNATGAVSILFLRDAIEKGGNAELCKTLMSEANQPVPADFEWDLCPPEFQAMVNARKGQVSWAGGAKPLECGTSCVGRPFITQSSFLNQPNTIFAILYGHLDFAVDVPGPFNRTVRYGYEAQFRCQMAPGARRGVMNVRLVFGRPVILGGGILEDLVDFILLPANLSRAIEAGIRDRSSTPATQNETGDPCTSIGVSRPADPTFDSVVFDRPVGTGRTPIRPPVADTVLNRSATVRFHRITRHPPVFGYTPPADPGGFHVFLNGVPAYFPDTPALDLPAAGGGVALNLCKTIHMNGADRLQLLFANTHGGAAWSQFAADTTFGAGPPRTLTTGRTVVVPGRPGPPAPATGRPGGARPQTLVLREFELLYTVDYRAPVDEAVAATPGPVGGVRPIRPGTVLDTLGDVPIVADPGGGEPPQPCREL